MKFEVLLKALYRLQSNRWSISVSVAKVLVACSASTSFTWHYGYGSFSSSVWSHAGPFNHPDSLSPWLDIPLVPKSTGFSMPLTCLHLSMEEFFSISAALLATNTCCFL